MIVSYIDTHGARFGVEPICKELPIAPSTYYECKAQERDPDRRSTRARRDEVLKPEVQRVFAENFCLWRPKNLEAAQPGVDPGGPLHH